MCGVCVQKDTSWAFSFSVIHLHDSYHWYTEYRYYDVLILMTKNSFDLEEARTFLNDHVDSQEFLRARYGKGDEMNEFSLSLKLKGSEDLGRISEYLKGLSSVERFEFLTGKSTSEY